MVVVLAVVALAVMHVVMAGRVVGPLAAKAAPGPVIARTKTATVAAAARFGGPWYTDTVSGGFTAGI